MCGAQRFSLEAGPSGAARRYTSIRLRQPLLQAFDCLSRGIRLHEELQRLRVVHSLGHDLFGGTLAPLHRLQ